MFLLVNKRTPVLFSNFPHEILDRFPLLILNRLRLIPPHCVNNRSHFPNRRLHTCLILISFLFPSSTWSSRQHALLHSSAPSSKSGYRAADITSCLSKAFGPRQLVQFRRVQCATSLGRRWSYVCPRGGSAAFVSINKNIVTL